MPNQEPVKPEGPGVKLWRVRWTLAAYSCALASIGLAEPRLFPFLLPALLVTLAVAAIAPQDVVAAAPPPGRQIRAPVWPDSSIKAVTEALTYPAYIIDATGVLRYANAAATPAFGAPVIGEAATITFRRPEVAELIARAVATRTMQAGEMTEPVPRERWFNLQIGPVPKAGGTPDFFLLTFMDMTPARRAEQMRSDFIANASHELRTPLASLRGFLETIKGAAANDKAATARFLDIMLEQSQRMSRLIDDLLSLSRIEMKAHVSPQGTVEIVSVLRSVTASMQPLAQKLGVTIEQRLPKGPVEIVGDRDELIQVFDNLVENACKYGDSGKKVELSAEILEPLRPGQPSRVEVAVRDFGPGIPAEHLPRLTERFYRVNVSSSRDKQGTGLGLAIVKHILNRHGVRLQIASTPGEGARFSVIFPVIPTGSDVNN